MVRQESGLPPPATPPMSARRGPFTGRPSRSMPDERDELLDRFMPAYDVVDRYHIAVPAPAAAALAIAGEINLSEVAVVRAVFKGRS